MLMAQDPAQPLKWRAWINRGVAALRHARYAEAISALQKAIDLDPARN
jgi:Tfp pilus assembly protein PilF